MTTNTKTALIDSYPRGEGYGKYPNAVIFLTYDKIKYYSMA